ncbi:MAG: DUF262 domain-containing HNH endonuclease family protein [Alphaproteobacteria bacterium]|nr:DUF262 domain-containing HNH endonuclease family protein [Alphaproteobacteria bacterium]
MFAFKHWPLNLLTTPITLEIPLYQRSYVWNLEDQWKPLWEDIKSLYEGSNTSTGKKLQHFFGTVIWQQQFNESGMGQKFLVIDGQQRMTTIHIFIAAFRDVRETLFNTGKDSPSEEFETANGYLLNKFHKQGKMPKLRPSNKDANSFNNIVNLGNKDKHISELLKDENIHQLEMIFNYNELSTGKKSSATRKSQELLKDKHKLIEAYCYFYWQIKNYFIEINADKNDDIVQKFWECFIEGFAFAVIELDNDSDPQIIFECMNGRGEPLLAMDLIKNNIFLRIEKNKLDSNDLHKQYWSRFDDDIWSQEIKIGRFKIPTADIFILHYLTSYNVQNVRVERLFQTYDNWRKEKNYPFTGQIEKEMADIANESEYYKRLITNLDQNHSENHFYRFLNIFDHTTPFPFLMMLNRLRLNSTEFSDICQMLESFLIRGSVTGVPRQGINKLFISLIGKISTGDIRPTVFDITKHLVDSDNKAINWISDAELKTAWLENKLYKQSNSKQLIYILSKINDAMTDPNTERLSDVVKSLNNPTIEHIMPQNPGNEWPLTTHTPEKRGELVHTIGNLTIVSGEFNGKATNNNWNEKSTLLKTHSNLAINNIYDLPHWDETAIKKRGEDLFNVAVKIWKYWPDSI